MTGLNWNCKDCGRDTRDEYYTVHDEVWAESKGGKDLLCIQCLETRLGRRLTKDDFTADLVNTDDVIRATLLKSRLA